MASTCHTFHSNTTVFPAEITRQIIEYIVAEVRPQPLGGNTTAHTTHHPIASVSRTFRSIYLDLPYLPFTNGGATAPVKLRIGEALAFGDLRTVAAYFENGPGRDAKFLDKVRFLSVYYLDNHKVKDWRRTVDYAFEAFEYLYQNWNSMRVSWLQLCLPTRAITSINDRGIWSLLKIRNLRHLTILGPRGCIAPDVRRCLMVRTRRKTLFPWHPLGVENVGRAYNDDHGQQSWHKYYSLLDARYKYLHDRRTVEERRTKQRQAYRKRQKRWPMLLGKRRRRLSVCASSNMTDTIRAC